MSFLHTLSSLVCTGKNFPVGHPSQIALGQARLTLEFFGDWLLEKKLQLVDMSILLILLSPRPGCYIWYLKFLFGLSLVLEVSNRPNKSSKLIIWVNIVLGPTKSIT